MKERTLPRKPVVLSESTQRKLGMYAVSATAAGVGLLALAQPADAKIVYTPTHVKVKWFQPLAIDLNHDGIVDFYLNSFKRSSVQQVSACQYVVSARGTGGIYCALSNGRGTNAIRTMLSTNRRSFAAALRHGDKIQRGQRFRKSGVQLGFFEEPSAWFGPWMNGGKGVKDRYLGLKFKIKGRFHYGWARVTVRTSFGFTATLTGYAYESVSNKPIIAGKTKGPDVITLPMDTGTLGHLALGRK